ncbi:MAG: ParB N-terminal domain-containing protein [Bosea sp. (in: a-proteobacteria)]
MKTQEIDISELIEDDNNANKGTERGKGMLDNSVSQLGIGRGIVVDKNMRIIGGNKTWEAAAQAGIKKVLVVETEGDVLVATKRKDMDLRDKKGNARKMAFADNRVGEVNLAWDLDVIADYAGMDFVPEYVVPDLSDAPANEEINANNLETEHVCPRCKFEF